MSAESVMESLGLNYAKKLGEKITSKYLPHNNYCIEPTQQDLQDLNTLDNATSTNRYHCYQSELEIMASDMTRLKEETDTLLAKERQVHAHKEEYKDILFKSENNLHLTSDEQGILLGMTLLQLEDWCAISIKQRVESQSRKIHMMGEIDKIEKKCAELMSDASSNMVYKKGGKLYLRFTAADAELAQPIKRPVEQVALFFVRMLTKVEKLTKIRLDPCLDLLKEYRDCFSASNRNYKMFNVAITRVENNKNSISRFELSQLIYDLLVPERQLDYLASIKIVMENPDMKKEMLKLASDKDREISDLRNKQKEDAKKVTSKNPKGKFSKTNFRTRFNPGFRGNNPRYNNNRGRGFRSGRGRGQSRTQYSRNNYGGFNRGFNNSYRNNHNSHSGDGNNFQHQNGHDDQNNQQQNSRGNQVHRGNHSRGRGH